MVDLSSIRRNLSSVTTAVAILALIALLCVVGSIVFAHRFVEETVKYAVDNIADRSGLSVFLVRGVVIVATMPFFWAVGRLTKNIWGLINFGWDSMALYKNWYGRLIVAYVGVYFLVIYWASLQALNYKYCAETPEGTWTSDSPGKDPVYGIELKSCTMDQKLALREGTGHLKPPSELTITDFEHYKWFDPVTGHPLVWYSALPNDEYRFFNGRGVDPHSGQELKPLAPEIVEHLKQLQDAQAAAQKQVVQEAAEKERIDNDARDAAARQNAIVSETRSRVDEAQSAFTAKDYESAIASCTKVLKTSPGNNICTTIKQHASIKLAEKLVGQGQAHFEKGEFDEALWSAEEALNLDPDNLNALKLKKLASGMKPHTPQ